MIKIFVLGAFFVFVRSDLWVVVRLGTTFIWKYGCTLPSLLPRWEKINTLQLQQFASNFSLAIFNWILAQIFSKSNLSFYLLCFIFNQRKIWFPLCLLSVTISRSIILVLSFCCLLYPYRNIVLFQHLSRWSERRLHTERHRRRKKNWFDKKSFL